MLTPYEIGSVAVTEDFCVIVPHIGSATEPIELVDLWEGRTPSPKCATTGLNTGLFRDPFCTDVRVKPFAGSSWNKPEHPGRGDEFPHNLHHSFVTRQRLGINENP